MNLSRNELVEFTNLSYPMIHDLLYANKPQPTLETVLKIADSFQVTISEVIGKPSINYDEINIVSSKEAMTNVRNSVSSYLKEHNIRPAKLAQTLNLSADTLRNFVKTESKSLRTHIIEKLADHIGVPIDEMIGRSVPAKDISQAQIQENASSSFSNKDTQSQLDKIKSNLDSTLQAASVKDEILNAKTEKPKSFVERLEQERANKTTEKQR